MKKIAVILCGSGFKDGSEIRESVAVLWALSQESVEVQCFAPDAPQTDVVNCLTMQRSENESRNMLVEAARITRGEIKPLHALRSKDWDTVILPGGFGAAKNLCSFALEGSKAKVRPELEQILVEMYQAKKPIGAVCIAPAIVALALNGKGIELTVGPPSEVSQELEKLGHKHIATGVEEAHTDRLHRVVTTPAYMIDNAPLYSIFTGIQKLVREVVRLTK